VDSMKGRVTWYQLFGVLLGCLLVGLIVFHAVCAPGAILLTSDDNIGHTMAYKRLLPQGFRAWWDDAVFWGEPGLSLVRPMFALIWALPAEFYQNWSHALALAAASFWLAVYLRRRNCSWSACMLGSLTAFWVGNNLTLTYAGHNNKFAAMSFAAAAICLLDKAASDRRWGWGLLAGVSAGFMFIEQADVAAFSAVFIAAFGVYRAVQSGSGWNPAKMARVLLPAAVVAGVMIGGSLVPYMKVATQSASVMQQDAQTKYDFLTQWSWPPEESIDFVAPGFMGWRSGEESGPYWGRMGRSPDWETTHQGFMNFKLENHYIGALPVLLALLALGGAGLNWLHRRREARTSDTLFWGFVCLGALVLAFGKYTPLYRVVAALPGFSGMRNPNKFLHIFQIALGICAAFGWDALIKGKINIRIWGRIFAAAGAVFLLAGLIAATGSRIDIGQLIQMGWPDAAARAIQENKVFSLWYAAGMLFAGFIACLGMKQGWARKVLLWVVPTLILLDAVFLLAPKYIQRMPRELVDGNVLTEALSRETGNNRMVFLPQEGVYNNWLTYLFPYQGIHSINVTQMSRMPEDYSRFFSALGRDPVRLWELAAVSHIVGPAGLLPELERNPAWRGKFEKALEFNVFPSGNGGFSIQTASKAGQHSILRFRERPPRVSLVRQWESLNDEAALKRLADPGFKPGTMVVLPLDTKGSGPSASADTNGKEDSWKEIQTRPGLYELTVESTAPAVLRVSEHFNSDWKATVNGRPVPVWRVDYLFMGVPVGSGIQTVRLWYAPSAWPFWLQMFWLPALLAALGSLWFQNKEGV